MTNGLEIRLLFLAAVSRSSVLARRPLQHHAGLALERRTGRVEGAVLDRVVDVPASLVG